ncbi:hypothetical protein D9M71_760690 [compost metagenome]
MLVGHALAAVTQAQGQGLSALTNLFNTQRPTVAHGFQGIGNQAVEDLPKQDRLAEHLDIGQRVNLDLDALAPELQRERLQAVLQHPLQFHRLRFVIERA